MYGGVSASRSNIEESGTGEYLWTSTVVTTLTTVAVYGTGQDRLTVQDCSRTNRRVTTLKVFEVSDPNWIHWMPPRPRREVRV